MSPAKTKTLSVSIEKMTPSEAEKILVASAAQKQRPLVQSRVRNLSRDMQDGNWRITHQAIAIDPDGILIDGQHRLAAVVQCGLAIDMLVARNADPETFDVIDTGRSRTPGATLAIAGYTNTNVLAAATRYYLVYKELTGTTKAPSGEYRNKYTPHDILRVMDSSTGERIRNALGPATRIAHTLGRHGVVTWLTAAIALLDDTNPDAELRSEFLEKLEDGTMLASGSPVLALRRWLVSDTGYMRVQRSNAGFVGIALFTKAWNYWVTSEPMQLAIFRVGIETAPKLLTNYQRGVEGTPVRVEELQPA